MRLGSPVYKKPAEVGSVRKKHYFGTGHIPPAKKMPGFTKYEVSRGLFQFMAGPNDVYLIGTLNFE